MSNKKHCDLPSSPSVISASVYCSPFWRMFSNAAGGTKAPLILLCDMWDSIPKVYAEWWKPEMFTMSRQSKENAIMMPRYANDFPHHVGR